MSAKKTIGYVNTEEGRILVTVQLTRWGRILNLRRSGKPGTPESGHYFTAHPYEARRLRQGYSVVIRDDWSDR